MQPMRPCDGLMVPAKAGVDVSGSAAAGALELRRVWADASATKHLASYGC